MSSWLCWRPRQRPCYCCCVMRCTGVRTSSAGKGKICGPCFNVHLTDWWNDRTWEMWLLVKAGEKGATKTRLLEEGWGRSSGALCLPWASVAGSAEWAPCLQAFPTPPCQRCRVIYACRWLLAAHLRGPRSSFPPGLFFFKPSGFLVQNCFASPGISASRARKGGEPTMN